MPTRSAVVLVHGLWMNRYACFPLSVGLRRQGFSAYAFGYSSVRGSLAGSAAHLADFVTELPADRVHLIGHSLGGLIVLRALCEHTIANAGRAVLLGSPVSGSELARSIYGRRGGKYLIGNSLAEWNFLAERNWSSANRLPPGTEIGIVAGSFRLGMATFFSRDLALPNDGAVSVAETRLPGAAHITLPVSHTGMLLSSRVVQATTDFLKFGSFSTGSFH